MATGSIPDARHLRIINVAKATAIRWCGQVVSRMEPVERFFLGSGDPRLAPPGVPQLAELFTAHFKSTSGGEVRELRDNFELIKQFLERVVAANCRVVADSEVDADKAKEGDTYAFVLSGERVIHFAERYFGELATTPVLTTHSGRSVVSVGPMLLSDAQKARVLVHEAAHARLGAQHSGGIFGLDLEPCDSGFAVANFQRAINNAYCYDLFARCLAQS